MTKLPLDPCIVCGGRRQIPKVLQKGITVADFETDPFCSTECAKRHYGVEITPALTVGTKPQVWLSQHGTERCYRLGCRRDSCRLAATEARKQRRQRAREREAA